MIRRRLQTPPRTKRTRDKTPRPLMKKKSKPSSEPVKQRFGEHLLVLRGMLLRIVTAVFVCFLVVFYAFCAPLTSFILQPVTQRGIQVIATRVSESLIMQLKLSLVAGTVLSMPYIIWEIWRFVAPALYPRERRLFIPLFAGMVLLFALGVAFSYVTVFPLAINLFYEAGQGVATSMWSVEGYFNFVLSFVLPFGLMFELPVVIFLLARHGKVTAQSLSRSRRYYILGAAIVAAILTPPDVVSQILLLLPMLALYEISALIARLARPKPEKAENV